jgi:hypothetical protein
MPDDEKNILQLMADSKDVTLSQMVVTGLRFFIEANAPKEEPVEAPKAATKAKVTKAKAKK